MLKLPPAQSCERDGEARKRGPKPNDSLRSQVGRDSDAGLWGAVNSSARIGGA
jgi:hypothetical protein